MTPMPRLRTLVLLATALAPAACDRTGPDPAAAHRYGRLAFEACTLPSAASGRNVEAQCGTLEVPEDPARPDGRRIALKLAWLPATGTAVDDPVFFIAGGPGQSAVSVWPDIDPAFAEVRKQRHIVLVDQRGTGGSNPLDCTAADAAPGSGTDASPDPAALADHAARCAQALAERADPRFYTTTEAVADLEAVREAIGAEAVNLIGASYGTRVAQQYAMRHPQRVRSLVLDGVVPNDLVLGDEFAQTFEAALALQSEQCQALPACAARYPKDLRSQLRELVARLETAPAEADYRDPATGEPRRNAVTDDTVVGLAFLFSYLPQTASLLPLVLDEAEQGRYAPLMSLAELMNRNASEQMTRGMQWSVICAEDADRRRADAGAGDTLLGPEVVRMFYAACGSWPAGTRPAGFNEPLRSPVPALLVSGELDPVTPPRYGEAVLQGLPNGRHLVLRGQGHGGLSLGCMPKLMGQFLESADAKALDAGCLDALSYVPPFTTFNGWEP